MTAWRSKDGTLPDDDNMLARYTKLRLNHWKKIRPILELFFVVENGKWVQLRLKDELESVKLLSKVNSRKAKGRWESYSATKLLENNNSAPAAASNGHMPDECPEYASPTPTPTPTLKEEKIHKKKKILEAVKLPYQNLPEEWKSFCQKEMSWTEAQMQSAWRGFYEYTTGPDCKNPKRIDWFTTFKNSCRSGYTKPNINLKSKGPTIVDETEVLHA